MKQIAAIITEYWPRSHADVLVGKFLRGFPCDDGLHPPRVEIASMYLDHVTESDTGLATAERFGVPVYPSILGALTLGGDSLAVDGVLIIGEHGEYPLNEKGQKLYPRRHLFEQVSGVISTAQRPVPVFSDKHLSYSWPDALWMYRRARELGLPFMAGSSLPLAWRRPYLEHPLGTRLSAAVAVGYGPIESYGFHVLETLQCMVERRVGGETGVRAVRCLEGDAVWEWLDSDSEMGELAGVAATNIDSATVSWDAVREAVESPVAFVIEYRDGLRGAAIMLNGYSTSWAYAGGTETGIASCEVVLQAGGPHAHFSYLGRNVEEMFVTGRATYPVERTLLTTGILAAAMDSRYQGFTSRATPELDIAYMPTDRVVYRPSGPAPSGVTLDVWPPAGTGI